MDKVVRTASEAVADTGDGASPAVGGFGLCGIPSVLIQALLDAGTRQRRQGDGDPAAWRLDLRLGHLVRDNPGRQDRRRDPRCQAGVGGR
jgi:3-oxoacid CoA-transferase subunit A